MQQGTSSCSPLVGEGKRLRKVVCSVSITSHLHPTISDTAPRSTEPLILKGPRPRSLQRPGCTDYTGPDLVRGLSAKSTASDRLGTGPGGISPGEPDLGAAVS